MKKKYNKTLNDFEAIKENPEQFAEYELGKQEIKREIKEITISVIISVLVAWLMRRGRK